MVLPQQREYDQTTTKINVIVLAIHFNLINVMLVTAASETKI